MCQRAACARVLPVTKGFRLPARRLTRNLDPPSSVRMPIDMIMREWKGTRGEVASESLCARARGLHSSTHGHESHVCTILSLTLVLLLACAFVRVCCSFILHLHAHYVHNDEPEPQQIDNEHTTFILVSFALLSHFLRILSLCLCTLFVIDSSLALMKTIDQLKCEVRDEYTWCRVNNRSRSRACRGHAAVFAT